MLSELVPLLPNFQGEEAHVRCFCHTLNLSAKGVLRPFEPSKPKIAEPNEAGVQVDDTGIDELHAELRDLAENGEKEADDVEGFVDVLDEMTDAEKEEWHADVEPVRKALYKVKYILVHSRM